MKITINKGSSETTCEIINLKSSHFLEWFIGFLEGDGTFFIRSNNTLGFEISQNTNDSQILYLIKKTLGFGKVNHNTKINVSRFILPNTITHYCKLMMIIGENLQLNKRKLQFILWNDKLKEICLIKDKHAEYLKAVNNQLKINTQVSWDNGWLSGFIDAEGCFRINYDKINNRYQIIFQITQDDKEILESIKYLLGNQFKGNIRKDRNTYVLSFSGEKSRKLLNNYLKRYPLRTKKRITWIKWLKSERIIKGGIKTERQRQRLERLINN